MRCGDLKSTQSVFGCQKFGNFGTAAQSNNDATLSELKILSLISIRQFSYLAISPSLQVASKHHGHQTTLSAILANDRNIYKCCHWCSHLICRSIVWQGRLSYICSFWCCMGSWTSGGPSKSDSLWAGCQQTCIPLLDFISTTDWNQSLSEYHSWGTIGNLFV